jgi:hypothetical protein
MEPAAGFINYGGTLSGIRSTAKKITAPIFSRKQYENDPISGQATYAANFPEAAFLPAGGPTSAGNALRLVQSVNYLPTTRQYQSFSDGLIYDYTFYPVSPQVDVTRLIYAATKQDYDTVLAWPTGSATPPTEPFQIQLKTGALEAVQARPKLASLTEFTQELFIQCGNTAANTGLMRVVNNASFQTYGDVLLVFAGVTFRFLYLSTVATFQSDVGSDLTTGQNIQIANLSYSASLNSSISLSSEQLALSTSPDSSLFVFGSVSGGIVGQQWVHIAVVKKTLPEGPRWYFYLNGIRQATGVDIIEQPSWASTYGQQPISGYVQMEASRQFSAPAELLLPSIHGFRFTPKALYAENFTPPSVINSFA